VHPLISNAVKTITSRKSLFIFIAPPTVMIIYHTSGTHSIFTTNFESTCYFGHLSEILSNEQWCLDGGGYHAFQTMDEQFEIVFQKFLSKQIYAIVLKEEEKLI